MLKKTQILKLLSSGKSIKEIAKAVKVKPAYVYYIRWTDAKNKAAPKENKSEQALNAIEPKRVMINLARRKDGAIIDLDKGGKVISSPDLVNHPPHYTDGGVDTLTYIEAKDLNYRLGNVVKYVSRAGKKVGSDPLQDLMKARFYLQREIDIRREA